MAKFKVGDEVRCIVSGRAFKVAGIDDDCVLDAADGAWMHEDDVEAEDVEIERYRRIAIMHASEGGYHASASCAIHFGYCDTIEAIRAEIDDYFAEEAEHYGDRNTPLDTPSLDTSFHDGEMTI